MYGCMTVCMHGFCKFVYLVHKALNIFPGLRHSGLLDANNCSVAALLGGVCSGVGCNFFGL